MTNGWGHDTNFSRTSLRVLEHLSVASGLPTWLLTRTNAGVSQVLAVVDPSSTIRIHQSVAKDVGDGAKGYNALALNTSGQSPKVIQDILKFVHDKGQGTGPKDEVGSVLYTRGLIIQALGVEAVRRAQEKYGKGKVMTGEQVRWGLENLALDDKKLAALGLTGVIRPVSTSCQDHMGSTWARVHTWDGAKWNFSSDWLQADEQIINPMAKQAADKYAAEKKLARRTPADCQS